MDSFTEQVPLFLYNNGVTKTVDSRIPSPTPSCASSFSSTWSVSSNSSFEPEADQRRHAQSRSLPRMRRKTVNYEKQCPQFPARKIFVALDCEMVGVGVGSTRSSLARVVVIDWRGHRLFDEYIQQSEPVTDYRTFVSGITEQDLLQATMPLELCRMQVSKILSGHILVGHGLENDLKALGIDHPWSMIRDTACYEPFMVSRYNVMMPRKLKDLVFEKLGKQIQEYGKPHSPYEDARWAMNLYKSVRNDWESCVQYMVQRSVIQSSIEKLHSQCAARNPYYDQHLSN